MDINCTHDCVYQENGKCNLSFSLTLTNNKNNPTDCPYYESNMDSIIDLKLVEAQFFVDPDTDFT